MTMSNLGLPVDENLLRCFSLGLEFDSGRRLLSDEELINAYPLIFSSFYNIPCKGLSLSRLNLIASFFPFIINLYPKSFLLLCIALKESIIDLFLYLLNWLSKYKKQASLFLTPADCFQYFTLFAKHMIQKYVFQRNTFILKMVAYACSLLTPS